MIWRIFLYIFLTSTLSISIPAQDIKKAKFVTALDDSSIFLKYAKEYFQTIFQAIPDYKLEIVSITGDRAEKALMTDSRYIGDLARVSDFKLKHPELLTIKLPFKINIVCLAKKDSPIKKCDRKTLKNLSLSKQRGSLLVNRFFLENHLEAALEFYSAAQGLEQLEHGRINVMLILGRETMKKGGRNKDYDKYKIIETLKSEQLYIFLKPEYADLAKEIKKQISILTKNNTEIKIYRKYYPNF